MSENGRKAVVTTLQVQNAINRYETVKAELSGTPAVGLVFDKGARGKGFALYAPDDSVVNSFETKEEALLHFTRWVEVAEEVVTIQATAKQTETKTTRKPAEKPAA
jgi:hypothetical protein